MNKGTFSANIVDPVNKKIFPGVISVDNGKIEYVEEIEGEFDTYILPGLVDAHVHVESSMLPPSEFGRLAAVHGTVATVSDPHELANVLGAKGVDFMIESGKKIPFKFFFGAPSCVPATPFESSGAALDAAATEELLRRDEIKYLSEMMNFPGVLNGFPDVMEKIEAAKKLGKPVDGHAPGLKGEAAKKYAAAGISTDHECTTLDEAVDKIYNGMKILIREGSAAKNFEELHKLIESRPDACMLCSDDKHPDDLVESHINALVKRALAKGYDIFKVLQTACVNPVEHYGLEVGLLQPGDPADFIEIDSLENFKVLKTFVNGRLIAENGKPRVEKVDEVSLNKFRADSISAGDIKVEANGAKIRVIEAYDGSLLTGETIEDAKIENGFAVSAPERDILKLVVYNRYEKAEPAVAFIKNFGLKSGAIASSVAHDSHNILAVGASDEALVEAINAVVESQGGMAISAGDGVHSLALPIGGLMSAEEGYGVARKYSKMDNLAKKLGSNLGAPFMTLSFMALLVIPKLKLSDKGLFDGEKFEFAPLFVE